MPIDLRLLFSLLAKSIFRSQATVARLGKRRILFLIIFVFVWPFYQLITWFFLGLDEIFFPGYRKQAIVKPLFIIGNFRSGSTFLHRLLSRDQRTFTSMRTADIFLMPSVTQRKIFRFFSFLDNRLGAPVNKTIRGVDDKSLGKVRIHKIGMFEPEEDENILLHIFSTFFVSFLFPFLEDLPPFVKFDEEMPEKDKIRIMRFYRGCVQRHLFAHGGQIHFVSKSPANSSKVLALRKTFPDCRIIYLARDPAEMVPSTISWLSYAWGIFNDTQGRYINQPQILQISKYWFSYPLRVIDELDSAQCKIMEYQALIDQPEDCIRAIYSDFGYPENSGLRKTIKRAVEETKSFLSEHHYDLASVGIEKGQIDQIFSEEYSRFGFQNNHARHTTVTTQRNSVGSEDQKKKGDIAALSAPQVNR